MPSCGMTMPSTSSSTVTLLWSAVLVPNKKAGKTESSGSTHVQLQHDGAVHHIQHRDVASIGDEVRPNLFQSAVHCLHSHRDRRRRFRVACGQ